MMAHTALKWTGTNQAEVVEALNKEGIRIYEMRITYDGLENPLEIAFISSNDSESVNTVGPIEIGGSVLIGDEPVKVSA